MTEIKSQPETQAEQEVDNLTPEQREKLKEASLFGTIGYKDEASYENFLDNMNLGQALFVLIASANFAQAKGSFNVLEAELLAKAIRVVRKNSTPAPKEEKTESTEPVKE